MKEAPEQDPAFKCCGYGYTDKVLDTDLSVPFADRTNVLSDEFAPFVVLNVNFPTDDIVRIRLAYANPIDPKLHYLDVPIGHFIILRVKCLTRKTILPDNTLTDHFISRHYCPFRLNSEECTFEILVHLMPDGSMSKILRNFAEGDTCEIKGPYGTFQMPSKSYSRIIGISQGVAITPIYRVMAALVADADIQSRLIMMSCASNIDHIFLREDLMNLRRYWNFEATVFLSRTCFESSSECDNDLPICRWLTKKLKYGEHVVDRRIDVADIENAICDGKRDGDNSDECLVLVCGCDGFSQIIKAMLEQLRQQGLQFESFIFR